MHPLLSSVACWLCPTCDRSTVLLLFLFSLPDSLSLQTLVETSTEKKKKKPQKDLSQHCGFFGVLWAFLQAIRTFTQKGLNWWEWYWNEMLSGVVCLCCKCVAMSYSCDRCYRCYVFPSLRVNGLCLCSRVWWLKSSLCCSWCSIRSHQHAGERLPQ